MNSHTRAHRIVRTFGITLAAGALTLASGASAQAATTHWQLTSDSGRFVWLTSPEFPKCACIPTGGWHAAEQGVRVSTVLFERIDGCTAGAGKQCSTTVPSSPSIGYLRFDADTCEWVPMIVDPA